MAPGSRTGDDRSVKCVLLEIPSFIY